MRKIKKYYILASLITLVLISGLINTNVFCFRITCPPVSGFLFGPFNNGMFLPIIFHIILLIYSIVKNRHTLETRPEVNLKHTISDRIDVVVQGVIMITFLVVFSLLFAWLSSFAIHFGDR